MPKRALYEKRPFLLIGILAAVAYFFLQDDNIGGLYVILIKGAAVGALATYAWLRSRRRDARILALSLGLASLADMGVELYFELGGAFFFTAHLAAISLYLRNPRSGPSGSQKATGIALLAGTPLIAWLLMPEMAVALYALALGGMAAGAWLSRFPRYRVGAGAVLFVISDFLILASEAGRIDPLVSGWLSWPTYFVGQFLICTGVVQTLRRDHEA